MTALTVAFVLRPFGHHAIAVTGPAAAALLLLLFKVAGLYDRDDLRLVHSTLDEIPQLAQLTGLFALCIGIIETTAIGGALSGDRIALLWLLTFAAIVVGRVVTRALAYRASPPERCMVIGEPAAAHRIRQKLEASRARAEVVASLPLGAGDIAAEDWQVIPGLMRDIVAALNVHRLIIAPTSSDAGGTAELIRAAKAVGVRVSVLPRMLEVVGSAVEFDDVDGMTVLGSEAVRTRPILSSAQASLRLLSRDARRRVAQPASRRDRACDSSRVQGLGVLQADSRWSRWQTLRDSQVPFDGRRRRRPERRAASAE